MTKKEQFEKFLLDSAEISRIQNEIDKLEIDRNILNSRIETCDHLDNKNEEIVQSIDAMCTEYLKLSEKILCLELRKNKLEKDTILFELDAIKMED
jgi:hypothetical protein